MSAFPGDPSPSQIANADQRLGMIRFAVDRLVQQPQPAAGDRTLDITHLATGPIIDVMIDLAQPGDEEAALVALAAELLYRLQRAESAA